MSTLASLFRQAALICQESGIPNDSKPNGAISQWVRANCHYRPETEFFIVLGISCALADLDAQAEGFENNLAKAAAAIRTN